MHYQYAAICRGKRSMGRHGDSIFEELAAAGVNNPEQYSRKLPYGANI